MRAEEILAAAVEKKTPAERAAYLDEACGQDVALRAIVNGLLKSHEEAGSFLEQSLFESAGTVEHALRKEKPGAAIGPYKLLERLGEGGMGSVYLAEQEHPVRRRVALKIVKSGIDSSRVLARFDQERQALTMMDHPNIARALDAGTTETGRPYFVMELVAGIPITRYCDQEHLTPDERLELFIPVCQAVQHAHQKGIIHRDIKPSNVLIALYDGVAVPKVIDFGVAKATRQKLTERTMVTEVGSIVGTLEYMAPEQAELNNLDIDTRADIYSLGVLLYELLTGSPPFTSQQLRSAAFVEMLRLIREVEPPRPSTRLSSSGELANIAANRKLEPNRLTKLVEDDLDWIVMKALEKDRNRRYATATALADDVKRYLFDEPVLAGPPTAGYRLRKFLRRNKRAVMAAAMVMLALVGGIVGTSWGLIKADQALDAEADQRRVAEKLAHEKAALADVERQSRERAEQQSDLALKTLNLVVFNIQTKLANIPGVQAVRRSLIGTAIDGLRQVARKLDTAPTADHALIVSHQALGDIFLMAGDPKGGGSLEARQQFEIARDLAEKLSNDHPPNLLIQYDLPVSYSKLGDAKRQLGDTAGARNAFQESLRLIQKLDGDDPASAKAQRLLMSVHERLGDVNLRMGNSPAALVEFKKSFAIGENLAKDDPHGAETQRNLYTLYHKLGTASLQLGDAPAARTYFLKNIELNEKSVHNNPDNPEAQRDLSFAYETLGDLELEGNMPAARDVYRKSFEIRETLVGDDPLSVQAQSDFALSLGRIGMVSVRVGETASARDAFAKSLEINQKLARDDPTDATIQGNLAKSYLNLGDVNRALGNPSAARDAYQTALDIYQRMARDDPQNGIVKSWVAASYECLGDANVILGNGTAARDGYRNGLEIYQDITRDDPLNAEKQAKVAYSFGRLGDLEAGSEDFSAAISWFGQGIEILERMEQDGKLARRPMHQRWLADQKKALHGCQTAARAIDSLEFALGRPKQEIAALLGIRSRVLARRGQHADASATAEKLAALEPINGENLFQAAEGFALCADRKEPAASPTKTAVGEPSLKTENAARAIEFLKQAYAAGYFQYAEKRAKLNEDRNLDAIRSHDDFKKLSAEIARLAAVQRPPIFTKWTYRADERGDGGSFEMTESDWVELKNGKVYAHFALSESTNDYVELYDTSRKLWVRLTRTTESYSIDQKNWHAIVTGTPVHEGASTTNSSRLSSSAIGRPKPE
jgi:serine/threonine protein kinase/tetratricopeptide (TPR) repeat protein